MGTILVIAVILAVLYAAASGEFDFGDYKLSPLATYIVLCLVLLVVSTLLSIALWLLLKLCLDTRTAWNTAFFIVYALFACQFEVGYYHSTRDDVVNGRCDRKQAFTILGWLLLTPLIALYVWFFVPNIVWRYMELFFDHL